MHWSLQAFITWKYEKPGKSVVDYSMDQLRQFIKMKTDLASAVIFRRFIIISRVV